MDKQFICPLFGVPANCPEAKKLFKDKPYGLEETKKWAEESYERKEQCRNTKQ